MKRKTRLLCFLLSLIFVFAIGLTACGGDDGTVHKEDDDASYVVSLSGKPTRSRVSQGSGDESAISTNSTQDTATSSVSSEEASQGGEEASASSSSSSSSKKGREDQTVTKVTFWGSGEVNERQVFQSLVDAFNTAYSGQIKVDYVCQTDLGGAIANRLGTTSCPDVFYVADNSYKKDVEAGYLLDITDRVEASEDANPADMWKSVYDRYYYSTENHRSGDNAKNGRWYGLPKDIGPTVIFYNESMFQQVGVKVFSVAKEDLAAFNAGTKADDRGQTKAQLGITGEVKEKGYFIMNGQKYFNNQIAMSWDECRDLANLLHTLSTSKKEVKGYFTEWWFNYGWSVGGNCIEYVESANAAYSGGFYDFTLVDDTANFIVKDDGEDVVINGNTYHPGEIITYEDKLTNEEAISGKNYVTRKRYAEYDSIIGYDKDTGTCSNANINVLPSQRDAFVEFVLLSTDSNVTIEGKNGYNICASPASMGGDAAKTGEFTGERLAMLVDGRWNVANFRDPAVCNFEWDVAPLPIYKTYDANGDVLVHGVTAGHSGSVSLSISKYSPVKEAAWKFVEFLAGYDGQIVQSLAGFAIPSQIDSSMAETDIFGYDGYLGIQTNGGGYFINQKDSNGNLLRPYNSKIFLEAARCEGEGDWAYLKTGSAWIDAWAGQLNGPVRNGSMSFETFINGDTYKDTYDMLLDITRV